MSSPMMTGRTTRWPFSKSSPNEESFPSVGHIPMDGLDPISLLGQPLAHLLGNHYRTMLAASAAKGHGQVALALLNVMRQQKQQQLRDPLQKLRRLREIA